MTWSSEEETAPDIKTITVKITADMTELAKAMQDVKITLEETSNAMAAFAEAWNANPPPGYRFWQFEAMAERIRRMVRP